MRSRWPAYGAAAIVLAVFLAAPLAGNARGREPYWPSEVERELARVEHQLVQTQKELFRARRQSSRDRVEQLEEEFRRLKQKQRALLGLE